MASFKHPAAGAGERKSFLARWLDSMAESRMRQVANELEGHPLIDRLYEGRHADETSSEDSTPDSKH